jgi:hypothetical protein
LQPCQLEQTAGFDGAGADADLRALDERGVLAADAVVEPSRSARAGPSMLSMDARFPAAS